MGKEDKKKEVPRIESTTYGVDGLLEWQIMLPTGFEAKPYITVRFENGHISGYGTTPATFTTKCPLTKQLIESCPWFGTKIKKIG